MNMLDEIENKASRGSIPQIILTILGEKSRYGYEICKEIERITDGELVLKQPSLYSSLRRLEAQELISSSWQESEIGAKRHYYFLSEKGKKFFEENKNAWHLGELISKLPTNEIKDESASDAPKNNFSVASQETLFNINSKKEEIKRINEDEEKDKKQFFFQFDLFNQNISSIKKPTSSNDVQKLEAYSNKYEKYDNNEADFEPLKMVESEEKKIKDNKQNEETSMQKDDLLKGEIMPIVRDIEPRNSFEEDNSSNFNFNKLVEENSKTSLIKDEVERKENVNSFSNNLEEEGFLKDENAHLKGDLNEQSDKSQQSNSNEKKEMKNTIERENIMKQNALFESNDYRSVIGKLFSNSQKSDPYEQNKFNTFKEIFPQTKIVNVKEKKGKMSEIDEFLESSSRSDIDCDDIEMLSNLFCLQGIKIKTHKNFENKKNDKAYTDKNRLNMVSSWITTFLMLIEIIFTYIFLKNSGNLVSGQSLFFFLGGALSLSIFLIFTLENLFDRYKLVVIKTDFKKGITMRLLFFIIISVLTFAVCLAFGMQGLSQVEFLAFWLLPLILSTNILVSYLVYYFLLSHKYFNI